MLNSNMYVLHKITGHWGEMRQKGCVLGGGKWGMGEMCSHLRRVFEAKTCQDSFEIAGFTWTNTLDIHKHENQYIAIYNNL